MIILWKEIEFIKQELLVINFMLLNIADVIYWAIKINLIFQIIGAIEIIGATFTISTRSKIKVENVYWVANLNYRLGAK